METSTSTVKAFGDGFGAEDWAPLMAQAYEFAQNSPDPSTQNAAILFARDGRMISFNWNQFPLGVMYTSERWERPLKYEVIEHAERNSIYFCALAGIPTLHATMVVPWAACADCARGIIQSGVSRVVRHKQSTERGQGRNWDGSISIADVMLQEAGVEVVDLDWVFGDDSLQILHSGGLFIP